VKAAAIFLVTIRSIRK